MKQPKYIQLIVLLSWYLFLPSCSCQPEEILRAAFNGMEKVIGEGFLPSDEIRALGDFQSVTVSLERTSNESIIVLSLENGDPKIIKEYPELIARKCAETYLRDFKNSSNYEKINVRFIQKDPLNQNNFAMQEYMFQTKDFEKD